MPAAMLPPWRHIVNLVRADKIRYALMSLVWIVWNDWPLLPGVLARLYFDSLTHRPVDQTTLTWLVAAITLSGVVFGLLLIGAGAVGAPVRWRARSTMQRRITHHLLARGGMRDAPPVGEVLSTLRDDAEVGAVAIDWPFDATAAAVFAVVGFIILLSVSARVTLLVFIPLAAVVAMAQTVRTRLIALRAQSREATARVTGLLADLFSDVEGVRALGWEDRALGELRRRDHRRMAAELRDVTQNLAVDSLFEQSAGLGAGVVLLVALHALKVGAFTVGDVVLFAVYLQQVAGFTGYLGYLVNSYRESRVSFGRMELLMPERGHLLSVPVEGESVATGESKGSDHSAGVAITVAWERPPVPGAPARLSIPAGGLYVVTGPLGSGKTRMLEAAVGLSDTVRREMHRGGRPDEVSRAGVGFVSESPAFLSGTVRENITLGQEVDAWTMEQALHTAVLDQDVREWEDGLDTVVGPGGVALSGGQQKRVALARALVTEPDLLVIDGIERGLDHDTAEHVWERLLALGVPILAASHDPDVMGRATELFALPG